MSGQRGGREAPARSALAAAVSPPLSDQEFALFQRLIHERAGVFLSDAKRALLIARLSGRLRALEMSSFSAYFERVTSGEDPAEETRMLDCILTNETHFFREPRQFELLERSLLPRLAAEATARRRPKRLRVWSAACSTGEEPYSIAMSLLAHLPPESGWVCDIVATDLSTKALERAAQGVWSIDKASEIPTPYLKAFMLKGTGKNEGIMKAGERLRALIRFARFNLNSESYAALGVFDLIFCRNVLIYFKAESKLAVMHRLVDRLASGGYLFVGHAETLHGASSRLRSVIPTVYVIASGAEVKARAHGRGDGHGRRDR